MLALFESMQQGRRKRGRPSLTWIKLIERDLESTNIKLNLKDTTRPEEKLQYLRHLLKTETSGDN